MKKYSFILLAALAIMGCTKQWNDLVSEDEARGKQNVDPWEDPWDEPDEIDGPQLYNMNFDNWSKDGKYDVCYGENATDEEKSVWASANSTTAMIGYPTVVPEELFLASYGDGKKAIKLQTQGMSILFGAIKKLAAGSIYTGKTGKIDIAKMSATIYWGVPFSDRPKALEGYACYLPGTIDWVQEPYNDKKGQLDNGHIFVILADWEEPFEVSPPDKLFDPETDTGVIGYGKVVFDNTMDDYEKFTVNIQYRNERTPKYVAIVASSSALGDCFTGSSTSELYLDELKFKY